MYTKKISQSAPGLIVLVIDDSGSIGDLLAGTSDARYVWIERFLSHILLELLSRCTDLRGDEVVLRARYYLYVILYGTRAQVWGDGLMSVEEAVSHYKANGDSFGLGGSLGGTDAAAAFKLAYEFLKSAVNDERFKHSFPPLFSHLTDGESHTDATPIAKDIRNLRTGDGNVVVLNSYIGVETNLPYTGPEDFPGYLTSDEAGPDEDTIRLFDMSSEFPSCIRDNLVEDGIFPNLREGSRAFFDVRTREMLKHALQSIGSIGSRADRTER